MAPGKKNLLTAVAALIAITSSLGWIYYREFRAPKHNVALHRKVGEIIAEQTAKVVGPKGRLVLVTIPTGPEPELGTELDAFRQKLKKLGDYDVKVHELDT